MRTFKDFKNNWKADLNAGFILFLIAVPLSVGIAMASGAPPSAGLIAAIIGGIVGSFLGGGHININGPAAGLIVIILSSIQLLGHGDPALGFKYTLAAITMAGVLQLFFGKFGWARLGLAFPSSVIHGMLTAIGVIIFVKQIHVGLGVTPHAKNIFGLILEIPNSLKNLNPDVAAVGFTTLISLLGLQKLQSWSQIKALKSLPAPLVAIVIGVLFAKYVNLNPNFLLHVPKNVEASLIHPDFSGIFTFDGLRMIITLALVASLESTLSAYAVDKMDPLKRTSDLNRDMYSKGFCNILCGLSGGLPIITEIVRSSANISQGARSQLSNFFHGVFIFAFAVFFPWILNEIPLASLAALLCVVGWRLAHPAQFKHAFKIGPDHISAFLVTLIMTLAVDLLVGIFSGLLVEFTIAMLMGVKWNSLFKTTIETKADADNVIIETLSPVIFSNSLSLRAEILENLDSAKSVTVNLTKAEFIDHTVMDLLDTISKGFKDRGSDFKIMVSPQHKSFSDHALASKKMSAKDAYLNV
ncbi:MAG: SulP family inorganic anion transporter [Pseudobdellovibrionaceae bacterium]